MSQCPYETEDDIFGYVTCPVNKTQVTIMWSPFTEEFYVIDYEREMDDDNGYATGEEARNAVLEKKITWTSY